MTVFLTTPFTMFTLQKDNYHTLLQGASLLGTGGGLPINIQQSIFEKIFQTTTHVPVTSLEELPDEALICTAYGVGSTDNIPEDFGTIIYRGLDLIEERFQQKIAGIFPGETNIEALCAQIATAAKLPLIDADGTGGRAVPLLAIDNFYLQQASPLPALVMSIDGTVLWIEEIENTTVLEQQVRALQQASTSNTLVVFDHMCTAAQGKALLTQGSITQAYNLGLACQHNTIATAIINQQQLTPIATGTIETYTLAKDDTSGLYTGQMTISGAYTLEVRNEYLQLYQEGQLITSAPALIMLYQPQWKRGIHTSEITQGLEVTIYTCPAEPRWNTPQGKEAFQNPLLNLPAIL